MSIKTYLKAAAVALPLAIGGGKAAAQAPKVVANAERIVAADTLKAMEQQVTDVPTLLVKRYKGHYNGTVVNGKVGNGSLDYKEAGHMVPIGQKSAQDTRVSVDAGFISGHNLPSVGSRISGTVAKSNNELTATGMFAKGDGHTEFIADGSYARVFPINEEFSATGRIGAEGVIHKFDHGDSYGQAIPYITAGGRYNHSFLNGAKVGAKAEIGGGLPINSRYQSGPNTGNFQMIADGEIYGGYKNVTGFVRGGHDAAAGANVGAGVRVDF